MKPFIVALGGRGIQEEPITTTENKTYFLYRLTVRLRIGLFEAMMNDVQLGTDSLFRLRHFTYVVP